MPPQTRAEAASARSRSRSAARERTGRRDKGDAGTSFARAQVDGRWADDVGVTILTRMRLGVRLAVVFAVVVGLLLVVMVVALTTSSRQQTAAGRMEQAQQFVATVKDAKFSAADFNGWQTAYAFDALRGVAGAAQDSGSSRKAFLNSVQTFRTRVQAGVQLAPDGSARRDLQQITAVLDEFMTVDRQVAQLYVIGSDNDANSLVMGKEIALFQQIGHLLDSASNTADNEFAAAQRDAAAAHRAGSNLVWGVGAGAAVLAVLLALLVTRSVTRPVELVRKRLMLLADGDLATPVEVSGRDEVAAMAGALGRSLDSLGTVMRTIDESSASLAAAAEEMSATSTQIATSAEESAAQAQAVADAASQVSTNVQTVSAGSEQMGTAIREIARSTNDAAAVAGTAVQAAETANATVASLGESSRQISEVVKVITAIAEQTNLLALNATIESARAGEAGKGFAVVAGEVKELAQETARATDDIVRRVDAIQTGTSSAVAAIAQIAAIIGRVNDYQTTIASAVEEQTATTAEINRSVADTAQNAEQIAANVSMVALAAQQTTEGVSQSQQATAELAAMSGNLRALVSHFRYQRAAEA
ncbi:methyl-accepting chemotaxis protein [Dactylosporangium sp. CA-233914]|uniref:methyl-accepting chemotaxis protein n=1 Tax=Dactylosporangium sp. CA-233914 TaxID=3239934 RepID=UPI003D8E1324